MLSMTLLKAVTQPLPSPEPRRSPPSLPCPALVLRTQVSDTQGAQMVVTQHVRSPSRNQEFYSCQALFLDSNYCPPNSPVPSSTGPSTPPEELQLNALDSSSVLVSWRPPLEPNGIIIAYRLLFSGNLSQPEHSWEKLYQDGGCRSQEPP